MPDIKSLLSPEGSIVAGLATVALVIAVYEHQVGAVSAVQMTDAAHPATSSAVKSAGWEALGVVAAVTLLARDPNIMILGAAAVIAEDVRYKHAVMANPDTGMLELGPQAYAPAGAAPAQVSSPGPYAGLAATAGLAG